MEQQLLQLGVGGMFAILVIREVFSFLKERARCHQNKQMDVLAHQIAELHQWHAVTDEDGVKVWYVRRSLEQAIDKLTLTLDAQTQLLRELTTNMQETRRDVEETRRDVDLLIREVGKQNTKQKVS